MAAGAPLYIGQIAHQAFMRVDEDGTEAAAATAVTMQVTSAPPANPVSFVVDRPFAFLLRDRQTGAVLFTGVVSDPG
jgi:serpin B